MRLEFEFKDGWQSENVTLIVIDKRYLLKEGRYVILDSSTFDNIAWYTFSPYGLDGHKWQDLGCWLLDSRAVDYLCSSNEAEIALGLGDKKVIEHSFVMRCLSTWKEEQEAVPLSTIVEKLSVLVPVPETHGPTVDFTDL